MGFVWYVLLLACIVLPLLWQVSPVFRFHVKIVTYYIAIYAASIFVIFFSLFSPFDPNNTRRTLDVVHWMTRWTGIQFVLKGRENLKSDKPFVLLVNHQSSIDVMVMASKAWPDRCVIMMKSSLQYVPFFNIACWLCCTVFVDRFHPDKARASVDKIVNQIKTRNVKVWVFPEGTRNRGTGLLPFKKGAFHMAIQAGIPVVPMVNSCYRPFYSKRDKYFRYGGTIITRALEPIPTTGYTAETVDKLVELVRERMLAAYNEISKEVVEKYPVTGTT